MRSRQALLEAIKAHIVPAATIPRFLAIAQRAALLGNSWLVEIVLAVLTIMLIVSGVRSDLPPDISTWRNVAGTPTLTWAGWWYSLFCLPLFQFLCWRWCWRLLIWAWFLWRMSRLDLQLIPTHPDLAGGLGGLGVAHVNLSPLSFGVSAMMVASFAEGVRFGGEPLQSLTLPLAAIVVGSTADILAPLVFFTPLLLQVKQTGLFEYGALATAYTRAFAARWLGSGPPHEELLGSADIQSLADLSNSFEIIHNMRIVPFSANDVLILALASAVPMLPLLLIILPLNELILRGVKSVLGLG
jgi:hypothetical protein